MEYHHSCHEHPSTSFVTHTSEHAIKGKAHPCLPQSCTSRATPSKPRHCLRPRLAPATMKRLSKPGIGGGFELAPTESMPSARRYRFPPLLVPTANHPLPPCLPPSVHPSPSLPACLPLSPFSPLLPPSFSPFLSPSFLPACLACLLRSLASPSQCATLCSCLLAYFLSVFRSAPTEVSVSL